MRENNVFTLFIILRFPGVFYLFPVLVCVCVCVIYYELPECRRYYCYFYEIFKNNKLHNANVFV